MRTVAILLITLVLGACSSAPTQSTSTAGSGTQAGSGVQSPAPAAPTTLKALTHADLLAAAKYATDHGYPARAAMWTAIEAQLTAAENQVAACKAAIEAAKPAPSPDGIVGLATLTEIGAEAVAQGIPAAVKINCEPIVVPTALLPVPRLP